MEIGIFNNECIPGGDFTEQHTLKHILQARAGSNPDQTAFVFIQDGDDAEEVISYGELHHAANGIAHSLLGTAKPGDRALMLFPPGLEFIKALFGCFYAGVIAVPAYPPRKNRSLDRLRLLVKDSGASIILSTDDIRQTADRAFSDVPELNKIDWLSINPKSQFPQFPQSLNPPIPQSPNPSISQSPNRPSPVHLRLHRYSQRSHGNPPEHHPERRVYQAKFCADTAKCFRHLAAQFP